MKLKLSHILHFTALVVLSCMLLTLPVSASASPDSTQGVVETSSVPEEAPSKSSSKQWIYFAVTSVLSLAVAIPLAIRSGNKKYGK